MSLDNSNKHFIDLTDSVNNGPSYFNANFDENGYVFDGVKIDVRTCPLSPRQKGNKTISYSHYKKKIF
jgi:hypothetical protein